VDTIFHRVPNALGNIEKALLETLAPRTHVTNGGVRGLVERLQLCLQLWQEHMRVRERTNWEGGKPRSPKILTGHFAVGIRQLCADGLRLHLGGPERGLGGLEAFPESLRL
jgi:hypothetical protein